MLKRSILLFIILTNLIVKAQQKSADSIRIENLNEVVVTATKFPIEQKNTGKIVYRITTEMINRNPEMSLADLLNGVTGIEINGNYSNRGQNLGYYIRGGRNKQVAVLIDGMNVSDPSSVNNDFDLRLIDLSQVEKIEVLKGASSTLYGTGAATGVINIILKKPGKKKVQGSFNQSIGTNASQEAQNTNINDMATSLNVNGRFDKVSYLLNLNELQSKGLSAGEPVEKNVRFQDDPFIQYNSLLKIGYEISKNARISAYGTYDQFTSNYDSYDFMSGHYIDASNTLHSIQKRVGISPEINYSKGNVRFNASYAVFNRNVSPTNDVYQGDVYAFDLYNSYKINKQLVAVAGLAVQYQDMYQKTAYSSIEEGSAKQHFYDPYLSFNWSADSGFNVNIGTRMNIHSEYGSNWVYNINPAYNISLSDQSVLKIFGSYSTAFVTPTLQDIFNKSTGIDQLNPEKDKNFELGLDYHLGNTWRFNTAFFYREETDKIGFDPATYQIVNDNGTFLARGFESELQIKAFRKLAFIANYTYINREKSLLLKIPRHKLNIMVDYKMGERTDLSLSGKFVDATEDYGGVSLPSYRIADLSINRILIKDRLRIWMAVTNIFNEDFQEIAGLSTRGRNYKIGLRVLF
ncbi:MAG: TonB-dependent receptor plug domain-containing protein [Flavobacteriaceae bacterium]|nr:TonB-dependent receptor plug domain-containing protein [Flavobacteriaceae bacterium]